MKILTPEIYSRRLLRNGQPVIKWNLQMSDLRHVAWSMAHGGDYETSQGGGGNDCAEALSALRDESYDLEACLYDSS